MTTTTRIDCPKDCHCRHPLAAGWVAPDGSRYVVHELTLSELRAKAPALFTATTNAALLEQAALVLDSRWFEYRVEPKNDACIQGAD